MVSKIYPVTDIVGLFDKELLTKMPTAQTTKTESGYYTLDFILPIDIDQQVKDFWDSQLSKNFISLATAYKLSVVSTDRTFVGCFIKQLGETVIDGDLKYLVSLCFDGVQLHSEPSNTIPNQAPLNITKESVELDCEKARGNLKLGLGLLIGGLIGFIVG